MSDPDEDAAAIVELLPPGGRLPAGPRTRANVGLDPLPGGAGDPDLVPAKGLFAPPERFDRRPFSAADAARTVTETAVETLRARGEPARFERLLGEILVGLDRAGTAAPPGQRDPRAGGRSRARATDADEPRSDDDRSGQSTRSADADPLDDDRADDPAADDRPAGRAPGTDASGDDPQVPEVSAGASGPSSASRPLSAASPPGATSRGRRQAGDRDANPDPVERLLALIREELGRPTQRRLTEIEPDRWWLADPDDLENAATPLADRVEWGVFSLLSTAGPMAETAFFERIASMFGGPDLPDEGLVRACLDSYRSLASTPERVITGDDLLRRSQEHTDLLAALAEGGHRLGMRVWIGRREQTRRLGDGVLGDLLEAGEQHAYLGGISHAVDDLAEVDAIWYLRGKVAFLFEVEWTAMLNEPLLRRHARIPPGRIRSSGSSSSPPSGPSWSATSSRARRCCGRRSKQPTGTSSSRSTCGRSSTAIRSTWPTSSRTSGSIRRSSGAASRCPCSGPDGSRSSAALGLRCRPRQTDLAEHRRGEQETRA